MEPQSPAGRAEQLSRHAAAFLGFSIPISVALDNILLVVVAISWLASGNLRSKLTQISGNAVALSALALFGMLVAGLLYGARHPGDGLAFLGKYADLLFIPIFITLFRDERTRDLALRWFCAAMAIAFVVAEIAALGLLEDSALLPRGSGSAFKRSTTHGLLSAYAAFVFALWAHRETRRPFRILYVVLALVAIKHVLFIAVSRTAYIVLALLSLYFFFIALRDRRIWSAVLVLVALFAAAYIYSPSVNYRVNTVAAEIAEWRAEAPSEFSSIGLRLEWYRMSLAIVRDHPLVGAGTGSPPKAYAERAGGASTLTIRNPHNEYLLIAVQTGLVGLALLLHLFWQQLRLAGHLATRDETHLARGLVIAIVVGCLFNSFLLDHTEGLYYAWFTGLLFGGLSHAPPRHANHENS